MTKLEERLNQISARICKPIYRDMVSRGQTQQMCKEMARQVLELPELKALVEVLGIIVKTGYHEELGHLDRPTDFAISQAKGRALSSCRGEANQALTQWRSFIDEESETL